MKIYISAQPLISISFWNVCICRYQLLCPNCHSSARIKTPISNTQEKFSMSSVLLLVSRCQINTDTTQLSIYTKYNRYTYDIAHRRACSTNDTVTEWYKHDGKSKRKYSTWKEFVNAVWLIFLLSLKKKVALSCIVYWNIVNLATKCVVRSSVV